MLLQLFDGDEIERLGMRALQDDSGCNASMQGLCPAAGAQAPAVSSLKPRKAMLRSRSHQVITALQRVHQEFLRHAGADDVRAVVMLIGIAAAIAVVAGQWVVRARQEGCAEHVFSSRAHGFFALQIYGLTDVACVIFMAVAISVETWLISPGTTNVVVAS